MLTAFLRSLLHRTDAVDDLFQETMLIAWRRLDDFDQSRPFGPWLRGIASNLVLERRRKFATRHTLTCEPDVLEALEHHFSTAHTLRGDSFRERADRLLACLERLPDKFRQTVELAYTKGLLLKQIAESLGEGEEAVKKRLQRARRALADCYLAPAPANTTPHEPNL
jgi:RNA polymerase sigma-70 factor (ECF subfamily)